jgi:hypothetical protein
MNKTLIFIGMALVLALFTGCEEDLPKYSDSQGYLGFVYDNSADSILNYSFVYSGGKEMDTVWIEVQTVGFLSDQDRPYTVKQVTTGNNDAVAGTHFVSLDDPSITQYMVVKADSTTSRFPIITKRDESLSDTTFNLKLEIADNGTFKPGYKERRYKTVTITSMLSKPTQWNSYMDYYFGQWGPVKHQFMIDVTGEKWDDDYIKSIIYDYGYVSFLINKLDRALAEENARRLAAGQGYLQEADGTLVAFGW